MQVVTGNPVDLPGHIRPLVSNNAGTRPGFSGFSRYGVTVFKFEITGPLRHTVFQDNCTVLPAEYQIFTGIEVIVFLPVHGPVFTALAQGACT
ncbi:Uncharacterised protein [Escherichia coli]|nr:Uncharacterised protein [Escherichia coli]CAD5794434.1 Uncharacterised protein [Escherichia coli]